MNRLHLINTTRVVPMFYYDNHDIPEVRMRSLLLKVRLETQLNSTTGDRELFHRWVHVEEWQELVDMPNLNNYGSLVVLKRVKLSFCLVQFPHPEVYFKKTTPSPRMCLPPQGTKSAETRRFNRAYVAFLNTTEASDLDQWVSRMQDGNSPNWKYNPSSNEEPPRKRRKSLESELFSSDSSDDESPLPSPTQLLKQHPVLSQSSMFDPPTDPRIVDLTHE